LAVPPIGKDRPGGPRQAPIRAPRGAWPCLTCPPPAPSPAPPRRSQRPCLGPRHRHARHGTGPPHASRELARTHSPRVLHDIAPVWHPCTPHAAASHAAQEAAQEAASPAGPLWRCQPEPQASASLPRTRWHMTKRCARTHPGRLHLYDICLFLFWCSAERPTSQHSSEPHAGVPCLVSDRGDAWRLAPMSASRDSNRVGRQLKTMRRDPDGMQDER
jgi:hypothetical protein